MKQHRRLMKASQGGLALILVLTMALSACQSTGTNLVRIYISFPLRGPRLGGSIAKGVQLAFEEIGSRIGNTQIDLSILDDGDANGQWQASTEISITQRAVSDTLAVAYIGPMNSGAAMQSLPLTNRAGIVQISPSTTWPGLTKPGFAQGEPAIFYPTGKRTFFRTSSTDDVQGPAAALWARDLNFRSFYVLDDGEAYGAGVAALFARRAEQIGLKNLGQQTIDKTAKDFSTVLTAVKQANPDVVYFGGTVANGAALLVAQMRAMNIKAAFMGPDAILDTTLIEEAQSAAEGVYATFVGAPPNQVTTDRARKFYEDFKTRWGEEPEAYALSGYDAAQVIISAIRQAQQQGQPVDRASVLTHVASGIDYQGAIGTFSFDRNGDTRLIVISGNVVQNGVFKFAKLLTER